MTRLETADGRTPRRPRYHALSTPVRGQGKKSLHSPKSQSNWLEFFAYGINKLGGDVGVFTTLRGLGKIDSGRDPHFDPFQFSLGGSSHSLGQSKGGIVFCLFYFQPSPNTLIMYGLGELQLQWLHASFINIYLCFIVYFIYIYHRISAI